MANENKTVAPSAPDQPTPPIKDKKFSQKDWALMVIAIVVILGLLIWGGGYYAIRRVLERLPVIEKIEDIEVRGSYISDSPDFSFSYPEEWGDVEVIDKPDVFSGSDYSLAFSNLKWKNNSNAGFLLTQYSQGRVIEKGYEGIINKVNLDEEKNEVEEDGQLTINDIKVLVQDDYFPSGANYTRTYRFFTPDYKIELIGSYSVGDYYTDLYLKHQRDKSIYELIEEDLGENYNDINVFINKHPEAVEMIDFYNKLDEVLMSILISL